MAIYQPAHTWVWVSGVISMLFMIVPAKSTADLSKWPVYEFDSGKGQGDSHTRLRVSLRETLPSTAPASLSSFTLCMWFNVTSFLDASTLLSYANSDQIDDAIRLRMYYPKFINKNSRTKGAVTLAFFPSMSTVSVVFARSALCIDHTDEASPNADEFTVTYMHDINRIPKNLFTIVPMRWHSICLVVGPDMWSVWINADGYEQKVTWPPLSLTGVLVLGQEQDVLDGGYTKEQSFLGELTGLTLWPVTLTSSEISAWTTCKLPDANPLLEWNNISWISHNLTGEIKLHHEDPCDRSQNLKKYFFLFNKRKSSADAYNFLNIIRLHFAIPENDEDVELISSLVSENHDHCPIRVKKGSGAWLGIVYDSDSGNTTDMAGNELNDMNMKQKIINFSMNKNVILDSRGSWFVVKGELEMCFIGREVNKTVFWLRGLPGRITDTVKHLTFSFVLAGHFGNGIYFHGFRGMHIMKETNTSRWCLRGMDLEESLCVKLEGFPVGRHTWELQKSSATLSSTILEKLSLSTCTDDEFTCSDATCIDLRKVCDFNFDCTDQSDEVSCTTAQLPVGYLHSYPPSVPLPVLVHLAVLRIVNFNLLNMNFQVDFEIKFSWNDEWIIFRNLGEDFKEVTTDNDKQVWQPQIVVQNSLTDLLVISVLKVKRQGAGHPTEKGYVFDGAVNPLVETKTVKTTVGCDFDLRWYPWDDQLCNIRILVSNVRENGLLFNASSGILKCPEMLEEYVSSCKMVHDLTPTNTLIVAIKLSRRYVYYLWTIFLPTSLLLIIGYGTLLLPVEYFNERGIMSLTTLLVFISLYTETSSSLPSTAYLKHIDVWFVFNLTFLSVIISVHLAAYPTQFLASRPPRPNQIGSLSNNWTSNSGKQEVGIASSERILGASRKILAATFIVFTLVYVILLMA